MYIVPKEICLKDGRRAVLRSPLPGDAGADMDAMRVMYGETDFLLGVPQEAPTDEARHAQRLLQAAESPDEWLMLCLLDGRIIARCHASVKSRVKLRHRMQLGMCVRRACWGNGIAGTMLAALVEEAGRRQVRQLELCVMAENRRARALYERFGFRIVQVQPDAVRMPDGRLMDEYLMILTLCE